MQDKQSLIFRHVVRALTLAAVAAMALTTPRPHLTSAATRTGLPRVDVVVVRLITGYFPIEAINAEYGTTVLDKIDELPGVYLLRIAPGADMPKLLNRMLNDRRFLYAEPDAISTPPIAHPRSISVWSGSDPIVYLQQPLVNQLNLDRAQAISRGQNTVVAVIDTGVQLDHPSLAGSFTNGYDFIDNDADPTDIANGLDDDGDGLADEAFGHGTHIAGIVHLVAPDAKLMPIWVMEADGTGYVFSVAKAIAWAAHNGASVINLSLGTTQASKLLHDALDDAARQNTVVVAAAGNTDWLDRQYPAADDNAIAVTSISDNNLKSSFANYGQWVDLAAPGESVISTYPGNIYANWSGTSMATPFVAGQAALIRSVAPQLRTTEVLGLMQFTAQSLRDTDRRYGMLLGAGRIDIAASVELAVNSPPMVTNPARVRVQP